MTKEELKYMTKEEIKYYKEHLRDILCNEFLCKEFLKDNDAFKFYKGFLDLHGDDYLDVLKGALNHANKERDERRNKENKKNINHV